jgi:hypothetical protein
MSIIVILVCLMFLESLVRVAGGASKLTIVVVFLGTATAGWSATFRAATSASTSWDSRQCDATR